MLARPAPGLVGCPAGLARGSGGLLLQVADDHGLSEIAAEIEDLQAQLDRARERRIEAILAAVDDGWRLHDIAEALGISQTEVRKVILDR